MNGPMMIGGIPVPHKVLVMRDRAHGLIEARNRAAARRRASSQGDDEEVKPQRKADNRPAVFDGLDRPALQGLCAQYDAPFADSAGRLLVLSSGSLVKSLYDGRPKRLLVDHDDELEISDTTDGLEFDNQGGLGLSMRFPLNESRLHSQLAQFVRDGKRACLSLGGAIINSHHRTIAGHDVEFVEEFRLDEVSVVFQGANTPAFVELVDLAKEPATLAAAAREPGFRSRIGANRAQATLRRLERRLDGATFEPANRPAGRKTRRYTVDESNRWDTERKEALQKAASRPRW